MSRAALVLIGAWAGLMLLLAATLGAAFLPLGSAKPFVGYAIAATKTGLILWFFMEMRRESGIARLAMVAGFVWLIMLFALISADYLTRK